MSGCIVVKFTSVTVGTMSERICGNTGAPACDGDRLTLVCRKRLRSVVLPADSNALATARRGTRSKNSPPEARTIVRSDPKGDHAKPTRGDALLVSVEMVFIHCTS